MSRYPTLVMMMRCLWHGTAATEFGTEAMARGWWAKAGGGAK